MAPHDEAGSATRSAPQGHAVRATSIIGGASIVNIALGLTRMKVAAIILGPVGLGVLGLLQNLLNAAALLSSLNLGVAGARQIVASRTSGPSNEAAARRAVLVTSALMALAGGLLFWLFRQPLAELIFSNRDRAGQVGWLAIGVMATAATGYQAAVLNAGRRIADIARLSILSAAVSALVGSGALILWNEGGILPFILAAPIATLAFGWIFVRRARMGSRTGPGAQLWPHMRSLIGLGAALTTSIFVSLCGQLAIRTLVERELGATALGHFQAAWTITTVYLFFIFQAMASDYLPRLTAAMNDRVEAQQLVDGQAEVGLLLAAPILLVMIGAAPWALSLLYTSEFVEGTALLRWQMMGDLIRLAVWPVALILLASGSGRAYTVADIVSTAILVGGTLLLLPVVGLSAPGIAYLITNLCFCALIMIHVRRRYAIGLGPHAVRMFALLGATCVASFVISHSFPLAGAVASVAGAGLWALFGYSRLRPRTSSGSAQLENQSRHD